MIQFGTILKEACVAVGVEARDKGDALEAVTDLLVAGGGGSDAPRLLSEILAREALATTGIGEGVAVPHALSEHIHDTSMAVARLSKPIDFDAVDGCDGGSCSSGGCGSGADHGCENCVDGQCTGMCA